MTSVAAPNKSDAITLQAGDILSVEAAAGSYGTVWQLPDTDAHPASFKQVSVSAVRPVRVGPFDHVTRHQIEAIKGTILFAPESVQVAALTDSLPRLTNITYAQRVMQTAINKETAMSSLHEKAKQLAEKAKAVPAALHTRLDGAFARLSTAEADGNGALNNIDTVIADVEASTATVKDVANQLTNGAPSDPNA